jgi:ParB-like chromosome segregation protein Spo0J
MSRPRRNLGVDLLGATAAPQSDGNMASYDLGADRRAQSDHVIEPIQVALIDRSPYQKRRVFDHEELVALAESIGRDGSGLLQPPTVRRMPNGRYQLVAGERRLRAARLNGLSSIRVQIREMTDEEAEEAGCRENIDRTKLLPWERCMAFLAMREIARKRRRTNAGAGIVAEMSGQHQRSVVANYLDAGEAVPPTMLLQAGAGTGQDDEIDPIVLRALTLTDLLSVAARATELERLERLTALVKAIRDGERTTATSPDTSAAPDERKASAGASQRRPTDGRHRPVSRTREGGEHTYDSLMRQGGFQKCIRAPIERMRAAEARKHLDSLAPAVAALATRVVGEDPASVIDLQADGAPVKLLAVRVDDGRWLDALRAWLSSTAERSASSAIAAALRT